MKTNYTFFIALFLCFTTISFAQYNNGVIVPNEGNYGTPNAELSYIANNTITNTIYNTVNNEQLGDVLQHIYCYRDNAYLVANNSNKIILTNRITLQKQSEFTVNQPRYLTIANSKIYVTRTNFLETPYACSVEVFNVSDNSLVTSIALPAGSIAEQIVSRGTNVYVMERTASGDDKLHRIDATTNSIASTLPIADEFKSMTLYKNHLYALASNATKTTLYKIKLSDFTIESQVESSDILGANKMAIDNNMIYFTAKASGVYNAVYAANATTLALNTTPLFTVPDGGQYFTLYGFNVIDGKIYTSDAKGFTANSEITVYNTSGTVLNTYTATMGVNSFLKNTYKIYAPKQGEEGSTAIAANATSIKSWATTCEVTRGFNDIAKPEDGKASAGEAVNATGPASNAEIVSLGDAGEAVLTFNKYITNGNGADFVVFENGFLSAGGAFLELAFVEVSSDGVNYFRFPAVTLVNPYQPLGGSYGDEFGTMDARNLHNFASKYKAGFGTPFDLDDIPNTPLLDKTKISHIKLIDVVGTTNPLYASYDSLGNIVKDPYPTNYEAGTGGFDLNAVGVINEGETLNTSTFFNTEKLFTFYPNPTHNTVYINSKTALHIAIYSIQGKLIQKTRVVNQKIDVSQLNTGIYIIEAKNNQNKIDRQKLIIK